MKNEKGFSLIVLVLTIIIMIIIIAITMDPSTEVIDEADKSKQAVEAAQDDQKIKEIITYEIGGTTELIDPNIDFMRLPLSNDIQVKYQDITYGVGYVLYLSDKDLEKVSIKTATTNYYQPFKDLTESYVVDTNTGSYIRLDTNDWAFVN